MGKLKPLAVIILLFMLVLPAAHTQQLDMIVLLDISESVFPIFDDLVGYLLHNAITNHLRMGDYFHLITFADSPQIEVSQRIESVTQAEEIVNYLLLLQPLGKYTDLISAMKYLLHYTSDLPGGRAKSILVLTDGIHDPPPGSPFDQPPDAVKRELEKTTETIRSRGWDVHIMALPTDEPDDDFSDAGQERPTVSAEEPEETDKSNLLSTLAESLEVPPIEYPETMEEDIVNQALGHPRVSIPESLGKINKKGEIPIDVQNYRDEKIYIKLRSLKVDGEDILTNSPDAFIGPDEEARLNARIQLPDNYPEGEQTIELTPEFSNGTRFSPGTLVVTVDVESGNLRNNGQGLMILLYIVVGLIGAAGIVILVIKIRGIIEGSSWAPAAGVKSIYDLRSGPADERDTHIELIVLNQSKEIGLRNVHPVQENHRYCTGGNGSRYLIFLYQFPRCIGELTKENGNYVFSVRKPEYFPHGEERIDNCLGKHITAETGRKQRVEFYFQEYISPLERINRIMRLTAEPGYPRSE